MVSVKVLNRYPKIAIRSKNDLVKRISHKHLSKKEALDLINDVLRNFDKYWKDAPEPLSEPRKDKYVRNAKRTPLGKLLKLIDARVLRPYDCMIPSFIFGGVSSQDHVRAARNLIGKKRHRTLLKADLSRFYEHVPHDRVTYLFLGKMSCGKAGARLIAKLCCTPKGKKGSGSHELTIARGFATSSRLAVWCNLDLFIKLHNLVQEELKGHDPRISVYVDDIGITASGVTEAQMEDLYLKIKEIFEPRDGSYTLPLNNEKKSIKSHEKGLRILGTVIGRNRLSISDKTSQKIRRAKKMMVNSKGKQERQRAKKLKDSLFRYKRYVERG